MRYPRKLKKGIRTLRNGKPKTKWQRKGQIVATKFWNGLGQTVAALAFIGSLPYRIPHNFKPGGIVAKAKDNPCLSNGELVMTRESAEALMRHINEHSNGSIHCEISGDSLTKAVERFKIKGRIL